MKLLFTITAVLLSVMCFAQTSTESKITELSKKRIKYLLNHEVDSLATIYDQNAMTVHNNGMIKTTTEHLEDVKNNRPIYKSIEIGKTTVKDFGTTAILVGQGVFNISMNGKDMSYNMVFTEVYSNNNGVWKLIARHASSAN